MEQVESTIVELGDMFVQLAGMVKGTHFGVCVTIINRIRRVVKIENCRAKIASAHLRDFEG